MDELLMTPGEGTAVFRRILEHPQINEILVSSGDLQSRIDRWIRRDSPGAVPPVQARKELSGAYVPPDSRQERIIAQVWQEFFGLDKVGVDDNLFELGATSLDLIQLNANLRKALEKNVPILTLFTYPTVRSLARSLLHEETGMGDPGKEEPRTRQVKMGKESIQARQLLRKRSKNQENERP